MALKVPDLTVTRPLEDEDSLVRTSTLSQRSPLSSTGSKQEELEHLWTLPNDKIIYLIFLIQEGQRFTFPHPYPKSCIVIQVVLKHDLVESNSYLPLESNPALKQELGFKVTVRQLKSFIEQNTQATLKFFATDSEDSETSRILIGKCHLYFKDVRLKELDATNLDTSCTIHYEWKRLLDGQLKCSEIPKIKIAMYYEVKSDDIQDDFNMDQQNHMQIDDPSQIEHLPVLNVEKGYFFLGKDDEVTNVFDFSFQFIYAKNLDKGLTTKQREDTKDADFKFCFHIFKYPLTSSSVFQNLETPNLFGENFTLHIASNPVLMTKLFSKSDEHIVVDLMSQEEILTRLEIPINKLSVELNNLLHGKISLDDSISFPTTNTDQNSLPRIGYCLQLQMTHEYKEKEMLEETLSDAQETIQQSEVLKQKTEECVLDLESWKLKQKERFLNQIRETEKNHNNILAGEWKKRESEREEVFRQKMKEIDELSKELRESFNSTINKQKKLEQREKILISKEEALQESQKKENLALKAVEAERKRENLLYKEEVGALKSQLTKYEEKCKELEKEVTRLKTIQHEKAQEEIADLKAEKSKLLKKITEMAESHPPYRTVPQSKASSVSSSASLASPFSNALIETKLKDLKLKRDLLLTRAGYSSDDKIIKQIEEKIFTLSKDLDS